MPRSAVFGYPKDKGKYLDVGGIKLKKIHYVMGRIIIYVLSLILSVNKPHKVNEENQEAFSLLQILRSSEQWGSGIRSSVKRCVSTW